MISTNSDRSVQRVQATYSGHQIQRRTGDTRSEFALVAVSQLGSSIYKSIPDTAEPVVNNDLSVTEPEFEQAKSEGLDIITQEPVFNHKLNNDPQYQQLN